MGFREKYEGSDLEDYANQLDSLNELYDSGDLSQLEFEECVLDLKRTIEINNKCADMQLKSDLIKLTDTLLKII